MKSMLVPIVFLTFFLHAKADQWVAQTSNVTANLFSVNFPKGDTGYACGDLGIILTTLNGGANWTTHTMTSKQPLYAIVNPDKVWDTAYAVGGGGVIWKTTDRGNNWTAQTSGTTQALRFVVAHGPLALAGGDSGVLIRTTNSGATWTRFSTGTTANLYSLGVTGGDSGNTTVTMIATSATGAIRSVDTGKTWSALAPASPAPLYGIQLNGTVAFAVGGSGTILKTTNSGTSWTDMSASVTQQLNAIIFSDSNNVVINPGYIAGAGGLILKTTSVGLFWTAQTSGTTQNLNAMAFQHGNNTSGSFAYAVGNGGVILKGAIGVTIPVLRSGKTAEEHAGFSTREKWWYDLTRGARMEACRGLAPISPQGL